MGPISHDAMRAKQPNSSHDARGTWCFLKFCKRREVPPKIFIQILNFFGLLNPVIPYNYIIYTLLDLYFCILSAICVSLRVNFPSKCLTIFGFCLGIWRMEATRGVGLGFVVCILV